MLHLQELDKQRGEVQGAGQSAFDDCAHECPTHLLKLLCVAEAQQSLLVSDSG